MKSCEQFVSTTSNYYNYTPSITAQNAFFYPICTGHFVYEAGYSLQRSSFDSFLLMYIHSGQLTVHCPEYTDTASAGQFVLLDCYQAHSYSTDSGSDVLWIHFDGPVARQYYNMILAQLGHVFSLQYPTALISKLNQIYDTFAQNQVIREALLSKQLSDILTAMILNKPVKASSNAKNLSMEEISTYINEHFKEDLSVEQLAELSSLSPYHFIRLFKRQLGFTPHEYLINTRINAAKYLLKTTQLPIKDICFNTGFSCESVFCNSFKKKVGATPAAFRRQTTPTL